jgi:dihydroorotate dehydrogenase
MYRLLIRPLLFLINPESVHHLIIRLLQFLLHSKSIRSFARSWYVIDHELLKREVFGLRFDSPVGLAAGFDKDAAVYNEISCFGFSFIEIGTVTPLGQPGNPKPRLFRLPRDKGLINRMGFNNKGLSAAVSQLEKKDRKVIIGGNIGKNTLTDNINAAEDYAKCFEGLYDSVDYFVINVSCPNISSLSELQDRKQLEVITSRLTQIKQNKVLKKPVLIKISPDLDDQQIDDVINIARKYGIDGIIATNTSIERDGLKTNPEVVSEMGNGGLSGLPLRDRSTAVIRYIHEKTGGQLPIIGVGGIMTPRDALEKLDAGATLLQVYTGFIYEGPGLVRKINKAILARNLKSGISIVDGT